MGRSYVRGRAPNLNRLSRARKHLALSPIEYSRNSQSLYVQLDARRKVVYSWKSSELKSVRAILSRVYVQLDARPIEEGL